MSGRPSADALIAMANQLTPQAVDGDRAARIAAIRQEIAAGTYETPEKLKAALEAFLSGSREDEPPAPAAPTRLPR